MNFRQAVKVIQKRGGYGPKGAVPNWKKKTLQLFYPDGEPRKLLSAREAISWARCWTSDHSESYKKNVKNFGKRRNRAATRQAIETESFDDIPQQGRVADEDVWNWD